MSAENWKAALFDLDGVVTDTAAVHFRAWKQLFDDYLSKCDKSTPDTRLFEREDYLCCVDGKSRLEGIRSFLNSRGLKSDEDTVRVLGERKNCIFLGLLEVQGVPIFDSSVELIKTLRQRAIATAVVSSSRNCQHILKLARLTELFDARIDGISLEQQSLKGKPAPDLFLAASSALSVAPAQAVVVEDAISGVQAGRAGHFGLVVGVARRQSSRKLRENGADIAVSDLSELTIEQIDDWFSQHKHSSSIGA